MALFLYLLTLDSLILVLNCNLLCSPPCLRNAFSITIEQLKIM